MPVSFSVFRQRVRAGFSLVEVVLAVGIFAVAVLSIMGLLLPNTKAVEDRIEGDVARRLAENVQSELQRYARIIAENQTTGSNKGMRNFDSLFYPPGSSDSATDRTQSIFLVATRDGSRVLVTGEDPYRAWNDTYGTNYNPKNYSTGAGGYYNDVIPASPRLPAENPLITATPAVNPPGLAFRDRYYLIEVYLLKSPAHRVTPTGASPTRALPYLPLGVRVVWPYRLPDGPADQSATLFNDYDRLPWLVASPARHSVYTFNLALTP